MEDVAGVYTAHGTVGVLLAEADGGESDLLADGARIHLMLGHSGGTVGELTMRDGAGILHTHDLDGSWSLDGDSVLLDHPAETFLRDMRLRYVDGRLTGAVTSPVLPGWRLRVTLVRD